MSERSHTIDIELKAARGAALRQAGYALLFLLVQVPMLRAVWNEPWDAESATSTLRLSLALQVAFGVALVLLGYRVMELLVVRERRLVTRALAEDEKELPAAEGTSPERDELRATLEASVARRQPYLTAGWMLVAAAGTVAIVGVLTRLDPVDLSTSGPSRIAHPGLTALWVLLLVVGMVLLVGVRLQLLPLPRRLPRFSDLRRAWVGDLWHRVTDLSVKPGEAALSAEVQEPESHREPPRRIITCSGGGIRSASFCLGALQALTRARVYHGSDAVVGVSGGGYMAAAFHYTGRNLQPGDPPPFAQGTAELALLRRRTRYLLPNPVETFRGVLSVIWGVLVNLAIIAVVVRALAWVLGWYLHHFGIVEQRGDSLIVELPTAWTVVALAPWGLAAAGFVLHDKLLERFVTSPDVVRRAMPRILQHCLALGTATAVLMLGVPLTLAGLDNLAGSQGTLPDAFTRVTDPGGWAIPSLAGTVLALITLGRTVWKGLEDAEQGTGRLAQLVGRLRTVIAPWLGTMIILAVVFVLLVRWTEGYATSAAWRANWETGLVFAALLLLVAVFADANRTSLHHFYRERLASAYLVERSDGTGQARSADASSYRQVLRVSDFAWRNKENGGPELVMAAVANVTDQEFVPAGRGCVPFVIAADQTGIAGDRSLPPKGTKPTRKYEDFADFDGRDLTVPAAMAISGAAFSPLVGRASARTRPVRVLLTVLNARLGVWLPNPYLSASRLIDEARKQRARGTAPWHLVLRARLMSLAGKPGPYRLLREAFGQPTLNDRKLYVTDGGHYDNLGLLEALRRKPREVYVVDASNDRENSFGTLAEAIATARMDLGVEITIDVAELRSTDDARAPKAWARGRARHDDGTTTKLFYLKAIMLDGLCNDLEHYAAENPDFPRRSTGRQLYDEWDFEAYRELGESLAELMIDDLELELTGEWQTAGGHERPAGDDLAMDHVREELPQELAGMGTDPTPPSEN